MLTSLALWLRDTAFSRVIQDVLWIIPAVQTVHILAIAVVLSSVGMLTLRLYGLSGKADPIVQTSRRFMPWIWTSLVILAISGAILITGEPVRSLINPAFQLKMVMLVLAMILTGWFQVTVARGGAGWTPSGTVKALGILTLALWIAIPVAGRWIAYMIVDFVE